MAVCVHLWRRQFGEEFFQAIDEFLEPGISSEEGFDLDTKISTFPAGLLVRKYVVIVLHVFCWILCADHSTGEQAALLVRKYVVIVLHVFCWILCADHSIGEQAALREVC
jgi:hypothetical protein